MDGELPDALRRELLRHYGEIRDELSSIVRSPHVGADLAQEAYFRALRSLGRHSRPPNMCAWLRAIARNVARDYFKRLGSLVPIAPRECDQIVDDRETEATPEAMPWGIDSAALADALKALPRRSRALIIGFYFEGKGCDALAAQLGVSSNVVKVRLHRARKKLRRRLISTKLMQMKGVRRDNWK
jgi:RNA polymerase sigma-70 factor (ECF subfamily)